MRRTFIAVAVLSLAACSSTSSTPEVPELTEQYACGYGFYASNPEQTVGLFIEYTDFEAAESGNIPETSQLDGDMWDAELRFGTDLFANWCDDVLEPGEPTPEYGETWHVSGTIEIHELPGPGPAGLASATLTDVEARGQNNELFAIDTFEIENQFWGTFAG